MLAAVLLTQPEQNLARGDHVRCTLQIGLSSWNFPSDRFYIVPNQPFKALLWTRVRMDLVPGACA